MVEIKISMFWVAAMFVMVHVILFACFWYWKPKQTDDEFTNSFRWATRIVCLGFTAISLFAFLMASLLGYLTD